MSTIIMDLCSYTRLGLTGYLVSRGVKKREINDIESVDQLKVACDWSSDVCSSDLDFPQWVDAGVTGDHAIINA